MSDSTAVDSSLRTVEWKNNKVIMIDQTKLPNELVFVEYDDFNHVANAIRNLVVRGAPAIGVSGAFGLALAALQSKATTKDELILDLEKVTSTGTTKMPARRRSRCRRWRWRGVRATSGMAQDRPPYTFMPAPDV